MKKKIMIGTVIAVILLAAAAAALTKTGLAGRLAGGLTGGAAGSAQGAMGASGMPGGQQAAGGGGAAGGAQGRGQGAGASANYAVVKTEYPHTGDVSVTSSLTGTVESSDVVRLYAKAAGDVTAVEVSAGDNVEAGQVLIRINTDQIASARNQLDSAEVSVNQAQSNLNRMQILYNGGISRSRSMSSTIISSDPPSSSTNPRRSIMKDSLATARSRLPLPAGSRPSAWMFTIM